MMDLRPYKNSIRSECIEKRKSLSTLQKTNYDKKIANKLFNTWCYRDSASVFIYASLKLEVDTFRIIGKSLEMGKRVALPYCVPGTKKMVFYYINSPDDLARGSYGILEPKLDVCQKAIGEKNSICVVPALSFDKDGYRLGYGGGYYDRFLNTFPGIKIGICYGICIKEDGLLRGKHDEKVDYVITENNFFSSVN